MSDSRRIKRMERNNRKGTGLGLNLIPMMDILTVLVLFLLFNSFSHDMLQERIALPNSFAEATPRETVAIEVSPEAVLVQGEEVIRTRELYEGGAGAVARIIERLGQIEHINDTSAKTVAESREITLLADKTIQFKVLKKIMSACMASGYGRISLAVIQKAVKG